MVYNPSYHENIFSFHISGPRFIFWFSFSITSTSCGIFFYQSNSEQYSLKSCCHINDSRAFF